MTKPGAAIAGYAGITVASGFVFGLPVGLSFVGEPFGERELIGMAYTFLQAIGRAGRAPPALDWLRSVSAVSGEVV